MQLKFDLQVFFLLFAITLFIGQGCKWDSDGDTAELEVAMVNDTLLSEIISDSNAVIQPTNPEETKIDTDKKDKLIKDLIKSEYNECDDILKDYVNRIKEFKSGNRKPLKEFKIQDDPKIKICIERDKEFAKKFKTLQDDANLAVEAYMKSIE
jgi:hypothetical protein